MWVGHPRKLLGCKVQGFWGQGLSTLLQLPSWTHRTALEFTTTQVHAFHYWSEASPNRGTFPTNAHTQSSMRLPLTFLPPT